MGAAGCVEGACHPKPDPQCSCSVCLLLLPDMSMEACRHSTWLAELQGTVAEQTLHAAVQGLPVFAMSLWTLHVPLPAEPAG